MTRYQVSRLLTYSGLLVLAVTVQGFGPDFYSCDPVSCQGTCHCPSLSPPGGQVPQSIPQFVLITHDDAISPLANTVVRSVTDGFKNPNGCNVVATWFTTSTGSHCDLAKSLYDENHEIALHTVNHKSLLPTLADMENEIIGARQDMAACGIPREEMVGFRSPYLIHNPSVRSILHKHNLLYDSSIIDFIGSQSTTTKNFGNRLWPYTMDSGIIQNCAWTAPAGSCTEDEVYPGMWEVPLWPLLNDTVDKPNNAYSMDPGPGFGGDLYTTLVTNFDEAYSGNRAPFPLFTHAQWFTDENIAATRKFIDYALSKGDVYFVTIKELLRWMQNPVSATDYRNTADCKPVDVQPPVKKMCQVYIVQPGDYLESIAGKFGVLNVNDLTMINPILQTQTLQPGDRVNIPPWDDTCPPSSEIEAIHTSTEEASVNRAPVPSVDGQEGTPDTPDTGAEVTGPKEPLSPGDDEVPSDQMPTQHSVAENESNLCQIWTISSGENIQGISRATGSSVESIKVLNGLETESLSVGQRLKIPPYAACCDVNACGTISSQQEEIGTRVDISMKLVGSQNVDDEVLEQIKSVMASELNIPAEAISAQVLSRRRRRRNLRQDDSKATTVAFSIATSTPRRLHRKVSEELRSGDLESILSGLGYSMISMPVVKSYEDGVEVSPGTEMNAEEKTNTSTFWTTPVIIGVAVGGSVALLAASCLVVYCLLHRRRKSITTQQSVETQNLPSRAPMAEVSLRTSHSKKLDPCEIVVNTGFDTPTTPNKRTAFR